MGFVSKYQGFSGPGFWLDLAGCHWSRFLGSLCVGHDLRRIPYVQVSVFHTSHQDTLWPCCVGQPPCQTVKPACRVSSELAMTVNVERRYLEDVVTVAFGGGFSVRPRSYSSLSMKLGAQISS